MLREPIRIISLIIKYPVFAKDQEYELMTSLIWVPKEVKKGVKKMQLPINWDIVKIWEETVIFWNQYFVQSDMSFLACGFIKKLLSLPIINEVTLKENLSSGFATR